MRFLRGLLVTILLASIGGCIEAQTPQLSWEGGTAVWNEGPNGLPLPAGVYGTKGTGSITNFPGARDGSVSWTDANGNFWLFGGFGYDSKGNSDYLNDLWKFNPSNREWTWLSGSNQVKQASIYGTKGIAAATNTPGARAHASTWVDSNGSLWLFGGTGLTAGGLFGWFNDLWKYEPTNGMWTWISGSDAPNQVGIYGVVGIGSTSNVPGARQGSNYWTDGNDLWLFGGDGYSGYHNDLWKFEPTNGKWTWMGGSDLEDQLGVYGTKGIGSITNIPPSRESSASWKDVAGNFWLFGGSNRNDLWRYEPSNGKWTWMGGSNATNELGIYGNKGVGSTLNIPGNRSNCASWVDGAGKFWLFGGSGYVGNGSPGYFNDLWKYDPDNGEWAWMSGSSSINQAGIYGDKGVATSTNVPGARVGSVSWISNGGELWLFGGGSQNAFNYPNDLWKYVPSNGNWVWEGGNNISVRPGVYGTVGIGATSNYPGARYSPASWYDSSNNLWLFGGVGFDENGTYGRLSDLWRYEQATGKWTWISGSNVVDQAGIYGTKKVGAATNHPGARFGSTSWVDDVGIFWLFGGGGQDQNGQNGFLNDLWKYDVGSSTWTWVAGNSIKNQIGNYGTKGVGSMANLPGPRYLSTFWLDSFGNLWLFGGDGFDKNGNTGRLNDLWKYEPTTDHWTWMGGSDLGKQPGVYGTKGVGSTTNIPGARWRSTSQVDSEGTVWLFGGRGYDKNALFSELNDLWKFKPLTGEWTWVGGSDVGKESGNYGSKGVSGITNIPGARDGSVSWLDANGDFWLFGGWGYDKNGSFDYLNDLWKYSFSNGQWTWMGGNDIVNQGGVYGTKSAPSTSNIPGARHSSASWTDAAGSLWLLGGVGHDINGVRGVLNDLWKIAIKTSQAITFDPLPNLKYGDNLELIASSTSGLNLAYASSNESVATISGNVLTVIGTGITTITAVQGGNDVFAPAQPVQQILTVNKANLIVTADNKSRLYGDLNPTFTINYTGFKNSESSLVIDIPPVASTLATIGSNAGTYTIAPSGGSDNNYDFQYINGTLTIESAPQSISFSILSDVLETVGTFSLVASSSSSLPITFTTANTDKISIIGSNVSILKPGSITIAANQPGNINYKAAETVNQTICIIPKKPVITISGNTPLGSVLMSSSDVGNQWYKDGVLLPAATEQTYASQSMGLYHVVVTIEACVSQPSDQVSITITAIQDDIPGLSAYPNPVVDVLNLRLPLDGKRKYLTLISPDGRLIESRSSTAYEEAFIVKDLPAGLYLLGVGTEGKIEFFKFFKVSSP